MRRIFGYSSFDIKYEAPVLHGDRTAKQRRERERESFIVETVGY